MSEAVLIVLITSMGGTFLTVVGAIVQQIFATKDLKREEKKTQTITKETKEVAEETMQETKEGFGDLKDIMLSQDLIIDLLLRDRLRHLLRSYQDKTEVPYADKELIVEMHQIYQKRGHNGTIHTMFEAFDKLKVI